LKLKTKEAKQIKNTIGKIAVAAAVLFALTGAGRQKETVSLNIFGNKGQVYANVVVSGHRIGKMKKDGDARSIFSGHIVPGEHIVKLTGNGSELWSQEITAYDGMEYFLDSSEGGKFTPPAHDEDENSAPVKKKTAPAVIIATTPVTQAAAPENKFSDLLGKFTGLFEKKPDVSLINQMKDAESKPVAVSAKNTKPTENKPDYTPQAKPSSYDGAQSYIHESEPVDSAEEATSPASSADKPTGGQISAPENEPVPIPAKPLPYTPSGGQAAVAPGYVLQGKPVITPIKSASPTSPASSADKPADRKAFVPESKPAAEPARQVYVPENKPVPAAVKPVSPAPPSFSKGKPSTSQQAAPESNPASFSSSADKLGEEIKWIHSPELVLKLAKSRNKPVMMYFYTESSEQCKKLNSEVYSNKEIINLSEQFIAVKVNAERYPNEASRYKVGGYPTVIFLGSKGTEKARMNGYYDSGEFFKIMNKAAK
jgi:thiol-disulfide isomerase/thioredoxin